MKATSSSTTGNEHTWTEDRLPRLNFTPEDKKIIYSAYIVMKYLEPTYNKAAKKRIVKHVRAGHTGNLVIQRITCLVVNDILKNLEPSRAQGVWTRGNKDKESKEISLKEACQNIATMLFQGCTMGKGDVTKDIEKDAKLAAEFKLGAAKITYHKSQKDEMEGIESEKEASESETEANGTGESDDEGSSDESSENETISRDKKRKFEPSKSNIDTTQDNQDSDKLYLSSEEKDSIYSAFVIALKIENELSETDKKNIELLKSNTNINYSVQHIIFVVKRIFFYNDDGITISRLNNLYIRGTKQQKMSIKTALENVVGLFSKGCTLGNKGYTKGATIAIKKNEKLMDKIRVWEMKLLIDSNATASSNLRENESPQKKKQKIEEPPKESNIEPKEPLEIQPVLQQPPQNILSNNINVISTTNEKAVVITEVTTDLKGALTPERVIKRIEARLKVVNADLKEKNLQLVAGYKTSDKMTDKMKEEIETVKDIWYNHLHAEYLKLKPQQEGSLSYFVHDAWECNGKSFKKFNWSWVRDIASTDTTITPEQIEEQWEKATYEAAYQIKK